MTRPDLQALSNTELNEMYKELYSFNLEFERMIITNLKNPWLSDAIRDIHNCIQAQMIMIDEELQTRT